MGLTTTVAKLWRTPSAHSRRMSASLASGFSRVWSIRPATAAASFSGPPAAAIAALSPERARRMGWICSGVARCRDTASLRWQRQYADVPQVAVALGVVQSIADHEFVGDAKAYIVSLHCFDAPLGLVQQSGNTQRFRFALLQNVQEIIEGQAGVEN